MRFDLFKPHCPECYMDNSIVHTSCIVQDEQRRHILYCQSCGHYYNNDYWYRLTTQFGQYKIVGTVVKEASSLPTDLLADEKHVHFKGEKGYIATTVGAGCVLGAALTTAYGYFQSEAQQVDPDYKPQTVNPNGWLILSSNW